MKSYTKSKVIKILFIAALILTICRVNRRGRVNESAALENLSRIPYEIEANRLIGMKAIPKSFPYVEEIRRLNRRDGWNNNARKDIALQDFQLDLLPKPPPNETIYKYFKECNRSSHLDAEYAQQGFNLMESMQSIFLEFSQFCFENDIDYWISHGSLIGWYWNQKILPWDDDIDIQTSLRGLLKLGEFNQSIVAGRYLVNVNPFLVYRNHQENNVIDVRFVDTETGIFLDITGLALMDDGSLYCKSPHSYNPRFLFPLHLTRFENIETWRNHKVVPILTKEYSGRALLSKYYRGNVWSEQKQRWIRGRKLAKPNHNLRNRYKY
ncbi:hypothetical protein HDV01_002576 [Terramyces sp. JEL0728]|nr:hypothetical protein HDV01_002576 [Terramyces sp. JEL0728]